MLETLEDTTKISGQNQSEISISELIVVPTSWDLLILVLHPCQEASRQCKQYFNRPFTCTEQTKVWWTVLADDIQPPIMNFSSVVQIWCRSVSLCRKYHALCSKSGVKLPTFLGLLYACFFIKVIRGRRERFEKGESRCKSSSLQHLHAPQTHCLLFWKQGS